MIAIAFTGQDGAGKSTQMEQLRARLEASGCAVVQVHQYGPTTAIGRWIAPRAKEWANRIMRRGSGKRAADSKRGGGGSRGVVGRLASGVSLTLGWFRSLGNWFRNRDCDVLILDRWYSDEVIRAAHKFGRVSPFGCWLLRHAVPSPRRVFAFRLDPETGWQRKKTREMTLSEYKEKTRIAHEVVGLAESVWPVTVIDIDGLEAAEVFRRVWDVVGSDVESRG